MHQKSDIEVFLTAAEINSELVKLSERLNADYAGKKLIVVGLMKGCMHFLSDLLRMLNLDIQVEIMYAVSYHGSSSTGNVEVLLDLRADIFDKHVLVIDEIIDTGLTLDKIKGMLSSREPRSLEFCVLFDKEECRIQQIDVKYIGRRLPVKFFIGYGMDYDEKFREIPYLGVFNE